MSLLIKNGTIVTASDEYEADLLIDGETISAIGKDLDAVADDVVDANGLYVLPGGVDQHTHFNFTFKTATVSPSSTAGGATASALRVYWFGLVLFLTTEPES